LIQKFVIHAAGEFCATHNINPVSTPALIGVELCVYTAATILFFAVERPFLQLRKRLAPRKYGNPIREPVCAIIRES
jgi:peptidoglycan/LPS O-acetylase OafA/YrhL